MTSSYTSSFLLSLLLLISIPVVFLLAPRLLPPKTLPAIPDADESDAQLSFVLASRFEFAPPVKQELLQTTSERVRLQRLCELLEHAVELVVRQEEIAGRARTNGKVDPQES